ncbi:MAG: hypothetical protein ACRD25_02130 [Terracidiphilus sp.]
MSIAIVENLSLSPGTSHACERKESTLASAKEDLVRLRFSTLLTARWAEAEDEDPERRGELRAELAELRRHYFNEIDEIAMNFGVQQAMDAKEEVERNVVLPRDGQSDAEPASKGLYE